MKDIDQTVVSAVIYNLSGTEMREIADKLSGRMMTGEFSETGRTLMVKRIREYAQMLQNQADALADIEL